MRRFSATNMRNGTTLLLCLTSEVRSGIQSGPYLSSIMDRISSASWSSSVHCALARRGTTKHFQSLLRTQLVEYWHHSRAQRVLVDMQGDRKAKRGHRSACAAPGKPNEKR